MPKTHKFIIIIIISFFRQFQQSFSNTGQSPARVSDGLDHELRVFFFISIRFVTTPNKMSRPMLLVFLLLILIITSQFEWKQPFVIDVETTLSISQKQQQISKREETVKEKIILSQKKNIQRLNELVRSLRKQLHQCRGNIEKANATVRPLTEHVIGLERQQLLEG